MARHVLRWYLLHTGTQVFVFVRFRCPRCKKLGQEVIDRDRWDWSVLEDTPGEITADERKTSDRLGPILIDEVIEFHFHLDTTPRISDAEGK